MKQVAKLILLIPFCLWAVSACAQSALDVRLTDQQGRALPNVKLTLKREGIENYGVTGPDGGVRFLGLAAGEYELVATADGYYAAEAEIDGRPNYATEQTKSERQGMLAWRNRQRVCKIRG